MKYLITFLMFFSTMAFGATPAPDGYDDDGDLSPANVGADFFNKQKPNIPGQIMTGDYRNVKSCNEITKVKIPQSEIGSNPYGLGVTKNNDSIRMQPKGELFSDVGEVIGMNGNEVYVRVTNLGGSREWGYSLTTVKTTKWIRDAIANGRPIYFVAKYVNNSNLTLGSGNARRNLPVREGELLCADILYSK